MLRQIKFYTIIFAIAVVLLILIKIQDSKTHSKFIKNQNIEDSKWHEETSGASDIDTILESTRKNIRLELRDYNFAYSGAIRLEDLVMETGGRPVRSIIVSSWRSGTTFLGEILNAVPGNFYHFQPLLKFGHIQITEALAPAAIKSMKSMFKCNFEGMDDYFDYGRKHDFQFLHNKRLWDHCKNNKDLCTDSEFVGEFCQLFPFQSMKVVRLRLRFVEELLADEELGVKVVFLTRDPRGVMQSRLHRGFCRVAPDCSRSEVLCEGMLSDYIAASRLLKLYPERLTVLRFEEFSLDPKKATEKLFKFLRLGHTDTLEKYLDSHTNTEMTGVNSTYRISRDVPFRWKNTLDFKYADRIQDTCKEAMHYWGYRLAHNATQMASEDFHPLKHYAL